jgi:hypothetical protein
VQLLLQLENMLGESSSDDVVAQFVSRFCPSLNHALTASVYFSPSPLLSL